MSIDFQQISKHYDGRTILHDVSFSVGAGKITALVGPNGSGKTTLIRILLGFAFADSGKALVLGTRYENLKNPAEQVSVLLETAGLDPRLTVMQQLKLRTGQNRLSRDWQHDILSSVGLVDYQKSKVKSLSLGMRQRLGLACSISGDHAVYILDEPTNGLDYDGILWLWELLRRKADSGATIFVTSHHLDELSGVIDTAIGIKNGEFVGEHELSSDSHSSLRDFYQQLREENKE